MYFDTCYIAKFYFNEPESDRVRELVRKTDTIRSSAWAFAEMHGVIHRHLREHSITTAGAREIASRFGGHVEDRLWNLVPVTDALLRRTSALILSAPPELFLRTADAVHLATARETGECEIWTSDRHMLAASSHFGLAGRSV